MTPIKPLKQTESDRPKVPEIKTLLVPTDFSEAAHNAFEYALHIAEELKAKIILLHIYQEIPLDVSYMPVGFIQALKEEKIESARASFDQYKAEAQEMVRKKVEVDTLLESGKATPQIVRFAEELGADMIIMGTQGAASPAERILGSITTSVIERSPCPVLAVPVEASYQPVQEIMYAMGLEESDFPIISQLAAFARGLKAELICTHIKPEDRSWHKISWDALEQLELLEESGVVRIEISQEEDVFHGLQRFINQFKIDMIAMTTHKQQLFLYIRIIQVGKFSRLSFFVPFGARVLFPGIISGQFMCLENFIYSFASCTAESMSIPFDTCMRTRISTMETRFRSISGSHQLLLNLLAKLQKRIGIKDESCQGLK